MLQTAGSACAASKYIIAITYCCVCLEGVLGGLSIFQISSQSKMNQPPVYGQVFKETNPPEYSQSPEPTRWQTKERSRFKKAMYKLGKKFRQGFSETIDPVLYHRP